MREKPTYDDCETFVDIADRAREEMKWHLDYQAKVVRLEAQVENAKEELCALRKLDNSLYCTSGWVHAFSKMAGLE